MTIGNKAVVAVGLLLLGSSFGWIGISGALLGYRVIAMQMVLMGLGLGFTSTSATESIMGVVRPEQAGVGSAVNDATREVGGTLGVAVLGSIYSSLYVHRVGSASLSGVPAALVKVARGSFGAGQAALAQVSGGAEASLRTAVTGGFMSGLHAACLVAAGVCVLAAVAVAVLLPSRPSVVADPEGAGVREETPVGDRPAVAASLP